MKHKLLQQIYMNVSSSHSLSTIASLVLFGLHAHYHNDPVAQNLRECAFAHHWRMVRARALAKPPLTHPAGNSQCPPNCPGGE
jgi:hypothetical protein